MNSLRKSNMLDDKEKAILERLADPDQQVQAHYLQDEDFQRELLGFLLTDRVFLSQSVGLVEPLYFSNEIHQKIAQVLFRYFDEQKGALPTKIFLRNELNDYLRKRYAGQEETYETTKLLYLAEINEIYDYYTRTHSNKMLPWLDSPEALLNKIVSFAKVQAMRTAVNNFIDIIKKESVESEDTWFKISDVFREALLVDRKQDLGLDYFNEIEERYRRLKERQENMDLFSAGFPSIDNGLANGGLTRGEIGAFMARAGGGKSLSLVHSAIKNMARGHKVLYVTTEMSQDNVGTRFDSMISLIGKHQLMSREDEVKHSLLDFVDDYEDPRRLVIKQFPSGSADVNTVKAFHSQLGMYGFKPDLVIVDYLGDLKDIPNLKTYESRFRMLRDLRGFGQLEGHCTLTAIHPVRGVAELKEDEFMDEDKMADAIHMHRVLDAFWTINQTDREKNAGVARMKVNKHREGKTNFHFHISIGYHDQTLSLGEIGRDTYKARMNDAKETDAEAAAEQLIEQRAAKRRGFREQPGDLIEGEIQKMS